jgi:hypothetical protein
MRRTILVTVVYCGNELAPKPDLFAIELDDRFCNQLREYLKLVTRLKDRTGLAEFFSITFHSHGKWIENRELHDAVLDGRDFALVDDLPDDVVDARGIGGHKMILYANGDVGFTAYDKWSGEAFETIALPAGLLLNTDQKPELAEPAQGSPNALPSISQHGL